MQIPFQYSLHYIEKENGELKHKEFLAEAGKDEAIAAGKEAIKEKLTGNIVKEIYVPGRIINIVMK